MRLSCTAQPKRPLVGLPVLIVAMAAAAGGTLFWLNLRQDPGPPPPPTLTAEAKAYVRNLKLSEVEMKKTENFAGQAVVEIVGKIGNAGDRALRLVEINCVFYDPYGQLVLRRRVPIVRTAGGPLNPTEARGFRLPFDDLPASWNQALPQLVIANIVFD